MIRLTATALLVSILFLQTTGFGQRGPTTAPSTNLPVYRDAEFGLSVGHPATWIQQPPRAGVVAQFTRSGAGFADNLLITVAQSAEDTNEKMENDGIREGMPGLARNHKLITETPMTVSGHPTTKFEYTFEEGGRKFRAFSVLVVVQKRKIYSLLVATTDGRAAQIRPIADQIFNSLKIDE